MFRKWMWHGIWPWLCSGLKFVKKTWRSNWERTRKRSLGFSKANMRCFNCHQKGHFARDYKEPKVEQSNTMRRIVTVHGAEAAAIGTTSSQAMVAQTTSIEIDWKRSDKCIENHWSWKSNCKSCSNCFWREVNLWNNYLEFACFYGRCHVIKCSNWGILCFMPSFFFKNMLHGANDTIMK